jgi:hypothetical protein
MYLSQDKWRNVSKLTSNPKRSIIPINIPLDSVLNRVHIFGSEVTVYCVIILRME